MANMSTLERRTTSNMTPEEQRHVRNRAIRGAITGTGGGILAAKALQKLNVVNPGRAAPTAGALLGLGIGSRSAARNAQLEVALARHFGDGDRRHVDAPGTAKKASDTADTEAARKERRKKMLYRGLAITGGAVAGHNLARVTAGSAASKAAKKMSDKALESLHSGGDFDQVKFGKKLQRLGAATRGAMAAGSVAGGIAGNAMYNRHRRKKEQQTAKTAAARVRDLKR